MGNRSNAKEDRSRSPRPATLTLQRELLAEVEPGQQAVWRILTLAAVLGEASSESLPQAWSAMLLTARRGRRADVGPRARYDGGEPSSRDLAVASL